MFGYIIPLKPELKIKEYTCFKSYYCGICKSMGKAYQQLCRFSLNYDAAFLAILLSSLSEEKEQFAMEGCIANPIKKKPVVCSSTATDYAAAVNVALFYYKMRDNWQDDRSLAAYLGTWFLKPSMMKARRSYEKQYEQISGHLEELRQLEISKCASMDQAAAPFADLMADLVQLPEYDDMTNRTLKWLGYNVGKWIYLLDAYHDIPDDVRSGSYNVLVQAYGRGQSSARDIQSDARPEVEFVLKVCLGEIAKAYELLEIKKNQSLLENIIYLGLMDKMQEVLEDRRKSCHESI